MAQYGYRIAAFRITPFRKPAGTLDFDNPVFGPDGALGELHSTIKSMRKAQGEADDRQGDYLRIDGLKKSGWGLVVDVNGGAFGETLEIVDTVTHAVRGEVTSSDALLRKGYVVLVVPPTGTWGIIIAEARGNQNHLTPFVDRLSRNLRYRTERTLRVESDVADSVAWANLLADDASKVETITFINSAPAPDHTPFPSSNGLAGAKLELRLKPEGSRKATKALKKATRTGQSVGLLSAMGIDEYDDDAFDTQKALVVRDGAQRLLTVGSTPRFIYHLGTDARLKRSEFLRDTKSAAHDTLKELGLDLSTSWWPQVK